MYSTVTQNVSSLMTMQVSGCFGHDKLYMLDIKYHVAYRYKIFYICLIYQKFMKKHVFLCKTSKKLIFLKNFKGNIYELQKYLCGQPLR